MPDNPGEGGPQGEEGRLERKLRLEAMQAWRQQGGGELQGNHQWRQFQQNYIQSGLAQWRAQNVAQQQAAADAIAAQQQAAQEQAAADAEGYILRGDWGQGIPGLGNLIGGIGGIQNKYLPDTPPDTPPNVPSGGMSEEQRQQAVIAAQEEAGQLTTQAGTQVPYAPMPDPIVYTGPGATQTFGEDETQFYKPKYLDYAAMGATPGLLTEQGVFGSAPDTTGDWYFGNNTQASLPTYSLPTGAQPYVQSVKQGGRIGYRAGGGPRGGVNVKGNNPNKRGLVDGPGGYWGPHGGDVGFGGTGVGTGGSTSGSSAGTGSGAQGAAGGAGNVAGHGTGGKGPAGGEAEGTTGGKNVGAGFGKGVKGDGKHADLSKD